MTRRRSLIVLGLATVLLDLVLIWLDRKMQGSGGPSILSLEFAGSLDRVNEIAAEWGQDGLRYARLSLWIDFAFMASYGAFFALAGNATRELAGRRGLRRLAALGAFAPACAVGAALFDAIENTLWLLALGGHIGDPAPAIATACAIVKFVLIALAILYALAGFIAWLRFRRS